MNTIPSADGSGIQLCALAVPISKHNFNEWSTCLQTAGQLGEIEPDSRGIVIRQIAAREADQHASHSEAPQALNEGKPADIGFAGFLREVFSFPPLDRERMKCQPCMQAQNEEMLHVVVGMISPLTKFRVLGAGFIKEGQFIGEGKDAIVHAVRNHPEWVIKTLKTGGAERAGIIEYYSNILAAEAELRVPPLTHLGDGRLLQKFIAGEATANKLYAAESLAAQQKADILTDKARQLLGLEQGQLFVTQQSWKVGVDPSYANFHFDASGNLSGWIDPLFSMSR
jgi:hypothetical protein